MKRSFSFAVLLGLAAQAPFAAAAADGGQADRKFFDAVEGAWVGPGEIVAGKYKGTKFNCTFTGSTPQAKVGMTLDGACRVGVFTQKMTATVERRGAGYSGTFLDGAGGKGLDVVSGSVKGQKVVFGLNRKQLNGAMLARLADENTMNVTVSVKVDDVLVPVIGVSLKRVDGAGVGSIAQE